ncbi:DNA polymerase III subunit beta [Kitasatospora sp. DSM 101779]|uniref:DNA polymerase III subunit beta n=1 Tax=Kitasatospora sp. DSM 101779 TaxID=2853165 RepID=UPI0021D7ED75|nr:DNA polymerase III subunit beta [Kitasatospora sp. DSM 101779]MCU7827315.1 DNA polymerase III subunit beta [Kitasatospora sp. DSM 101779]
MKLRLSVQHLAAAVTHTVRAVSTRPVVPVMAGILVTTADDGLHLAASDYEVYATDRVHAEIADDGRILVPGRLLADICARLPKGADVDLEANDTRLTLTCRRSRFELPLLPVDEYPQLPGLPPAVATVHGEAWAEAVAQVAFAASTEEALPALTGVHVTLDSDELTMVATNRYRIGHRRVTVQPAPAPAPAPAGKGGGRKKAGANAAGGVEALIPAKTFGDLARAYDTDRPLTLHHGGELWGWSSCGSSFMTRLISAEFPKTVAMIPNTDGTISAPAAELTAAVQRVALVALANAPVRLTLDQGLLRIEAGVGDDAHGCDAIEVTATGDLADGYSIAFNPAFLGDGIKACAASEVVLHVGDPHKPAVLTAHTGADDQDIAEQPYRYVVMPVRLSGS